MDSVTCSEGGGGTILTDEQRGLEPEPRLLEDAVREVEHRRLAREL